MALTAEASPSNLPQPSTGRLEVTSVLTRSRGFDLFPQIIPSATTPRYLHFTRASEAPAGTPVGKLPSRQLCRPSSRSPCPAENACQSSPCFCR